MKYANCGKKKKNNAAVTDLLNRLDRAKIPEWMEPKKKHVQDLTGIPVLFLSDIHYDEVVDPRQIGGVNEYTLAIADRRIDNTINRAVDLAMHSIASPKYDGCILALGGDLLSGIIHEELRETNESPIFVAAVALEEKLVSAIQFLADTFGSVFVPAVVGNHGRMTKKPQAKNRAYDNFEWIVLKHVAQRFSGDDRVTVFVSDSTDVTFSVYGTTFCLTHGDQFRGGAGISGAFAPLMLGKHRKTSRDASVGKPFDVLMMGHWHQYIHLNSLIVNSSVKGYDEYANVNNFPYEPPQQSFFIVHPVYGVTFRMPVYCDEMRVKSKEKIKVIL